MLKDNGKLYCAFIDYENAFDTVIHEALWQFLYGNVLAALEIQPGVSSFFEIALGV